MRYLQRENDIKLCPLKINLLTPSYNQAEFIRSTIESVQSQTGNFELEYTVLDGGSSDGTKEILEGYGSSLRWHIARDDGKVNAINNGLRAATGDVLGG